MYCRVLYCTVLYCNAGWSEFTVLQLAGAGFEGPIWSAEKVRKFGHKQRTRRQTIKQFEN